MKVLGQKSPDSGLVREEKTRMPFEVLPVRYCPLKGFNAWLGITSQLLPLSSPSGIEESIVSGELTPFEFTFAELPTLILEHIFHPRMAGRIHHWRHGM